MDKHLMNLKAFRNGKLDDGKTVGGRGSLTENKIEQIQRYYGLAIQPNALQKPNPTSHNVSVSVHAIKKNIIAILNHYVQHDNPKKQHRFFPIGEDDLCLIKEQYLKF